MTTKSRDSDLHCPAAEPHFSFCAELRHADTSLYDYGADKPARNNADPSFLLTSLLLKMVGPLLRLPCLPALGLEF